MQKKGVEQQTGIIRTEEGCVLDGMKPLPYRTYLNKHAEGNLVIFLHTFLLKSIHTTDGIIFVIAPIEHDCLGGKGLMGRGKGGEEGV